MVTRKSHVALGDTARVLAGAPPAAIRPDLETGPRELRMFWIRCRRHRERPPWMPGVTLMHGGRRVGGTVIVVHDHDLFVDALGRRP